MSQTVKIDAAAQDAIAEIVGTQGLLRQHER